MVGRRDVVQSAGDAQGDNAGFVEVRSWRARSSGVEAFAGGGGGPDGVAGGGGGWMGHGAVRPAVLFW